MVLLRFEFEIGESKLKLESLDSLELPCGVLGCWWCSCRKRSVGNSMKIISTTIRVYFISSNYACYPTVLRLSKNTNNAISTPSHFI